jgi:hypothetical protein
MVPMAVATILMAVSGLSELLIPPGIGAPGAGKVVVSIACQQPEAVMMEDYEPIPLDRLVGTARLIVSGSVTSAEGDAFVLHVDRVLAGETPPSEIEVTQFHPSRFEGGARSVPYRAGQSFLLFLAEDQEKKGGTRWNIIGIGGEGEMPVDAGFVYFHGRNVEGVPFGKHIVQGAERKIQRWDSMQFFDAVKRYRVCYNWAGVRDRPTPRPICDQTSLDRYSQRSEIHKYLARLTERRLKHR